MQNKKSNEQLDEKINDWINPNQNGKNSSLEKEQNNNHYERYNKNYNKMYKKLNIFNDLYADFKKIVSQQYRMNMNEAGNLIILNFLRQENPMEKLEYMKQNYVSDLRKLHLKEENRIKNITVD